MSDMHSESYFDPQAQGYSETSAEPSSSSLRLIATATFGLEAVVSRELTDLGLEPQTTENGRVYFTGDESSICLTNLWLRAADRVLLCMGQFPATDFGQLYDQTYALPWHEWLDRDAAFPVSGKSLKSQLSSVPACQKIVKKAIVEKLKAAHRVNDLPETGPSYSVEIAMLNDVATLTIDTSGAGLHKRGYRAAAGPAPLKETLAAAMIMLSFWKPERPLIDPFCGSGTIPIEAALIGRNIAPGLNRSFASEAWPRIDRSLWDEAREDARSRICPELPERIIGTDIDERSPRLARHHSQLAGVENDIHFQCKPFDELTSKRDYGCIICNPPYGLRLNDDIGIHRLYRSMPEVFRRLKTWSTYVLTSYPDFERVMGQAADKRRKLYNGRIECTYYQFYGPRPGSQKTEAKPAFGGLSEHASTQADMFANRLIKTAKHMRKWPQRGITCYRLYERDIPEVPLVVDIYEDALHISEYDRPNDHTVAQHAEWLDLMAVTAGKALNIPKERVFLKRRERQRGDSQYEKVSERRHTMTVNEGGLKFEVNLSDYVDTGLFLDHRILRGKVRDMISGKRFLNLFAYTGSFTVYAASGGAANTTTVDLSNTYLDWAQRNLELNNLSGRHHQLIRQDVMEFLRSHKPERCYDVAVVDPPTFSNSRKTEQDFDVQRDHVEMLQRVLGLMSRGGIVFFSTNFRRFKLNAEALAPAKVRDITPQTLSEDFRNRKIHYCWEIINQQ